MHHFQGEFGGRTTLVWRTREVPSTVLVSISNSHFYLHAFHVHRFIACLVLILIMPYAMFVSPMTYMISI